MKVAILHSSFSTMGGAERYIEALNTEFVSRGILFRIFNGQEYRNATIDSSKRLLFRWYLQLMDIIGCPNYRLVHDIETYEPDLIHVHNWNRVRSSTIKRLSKKYPVIMTLHDYYVIHPAIHKIRQSNEFFKWMLKIRTTILFKKFADTKIIFTSSHLAKESQKYSIAPIKSKFSILYSPITELAKHAKHHGRPRVYGFLGMFESNKGVLPLLKAIKASSIDALFFFAGKGTFENEVKSAADNDTRIKYFGYLGVQEVLDFYRNLTFFVFPGEGLESFPLVCANALAQGIPIIIHEDHVLEYCNKSNCILFGDKSQHKSLLEALEYSSGLDDSEFSLMSSKALETGRKFPNLTEHVNCLLREYVDISKSRIV